MQVQPLRTVIGVFFGLALAGWRWLEHNIVPFRGILYPPSRMHPLQFSPSCLDYMSHRYSPVHLADALGPISHV